MDTRRIVASWLEGPGAVTGATGAIARPGERLGLPAEGPGSLARPGRRLAALILDWAASLLVARLIAPDLIYGSTSSSLVTLAVFAAEVALLTWLAGGSFGHRLVGLRVVRADGAGSGPLRAIVRTLLVVLVVPALIWDRDGRGLHDRFCGTLLLRAGTPAAARTP